MRRQLLRGLALIAFASCAVLTAAGAAAQPPKRILLIHSFGRDFAPYDAIASAFRTAFARDARDPVAIFESTLDAGRTAPGETDEAFFTYLRARFAGSAPDLVVTMGPPAARFYVEHRDRLFPKTPLLVTAVEERLARASQLRAGDAAVVPRFDLGRFLDNALQLLPETATIAVVLGTSPLETFWSNELRREVDRRAGRVNFVFMNGLSLDEMADRVAHLPPDSAVLFGLLIVDGAGIAMDRQDALSRLHAVANAPIFGLFESEIGRGVVGGPYASQSRGGREAAAVAHRILRGAVAGAPEVVADDLEPPAYDWRELRRWKIDESRLPPGSEIRFRPPSLWDEHRLAVVLAASAFVLQAALIAGLVRQRMRRRNAEQQARTLGGRLITAYEDERRRVARELHDDVTQRMAALSIRTARVEAEAGNREAAERAHAVGDELAKLAVDVHALSYRLHPSVIEDLGLVEALRAECDRVSRNESLRVELDAADVTGAVPPDAALGLFRVVQEALRNVARHAKATEARVVLGRVAGGLRLTVSDNGAGFDKSRVEERASLGLVSMRERVRLLGGNIDIAGHPGRGTVLTAWVPLPEAG